MSGTWFIDSGCPKVCARKVGDPPEVHTHYVLPSNLVLPTAAVDKLHSKSTP